MPTQNEAAQIQIMFREDVFGSINACFGSNRCAHPADYIIRFMDGLPGFQVILERGACRGHLGGVAAEALLLTQKGCTLK